MGSALNSLLLEFNGTVEWAQVVAILVGAGTMIVGVTTFLDKVTKKAKQEIKEALQTEIDDLKIENREQREEIGSLKTRVFNLENGQRESRAFLISALEESVRIGNDTIKSKITLAMEKLH